MPAPPTATPAHIRDVNRRYHDAAADGYDSKWGIDFGTVGRDQVEGKLRKALGRTPGPPFERALEIGAGTGYFGLNLLQMGTVRELVATDISAGMLDSLAATAGRLGVKVETLLTDAEQLPFPDASFDLVFGHAILHHIPDLEGAFAEFRRVLRPGGTIAFCGEPSRNGDRIAALPKRAGAAIAPLWRRVLNVPALATENGAAEEGHGLESEVDVHAFAPADLRGLATDAGFEEVRVSGEELVANVYGWLVRAVEASAEPDRVPWRWRTFAYHSYVGLQRVDTALLEPRLPAELFYNLLLSARLPEQFRRPSAA